jgi:hypothetical protein
VSKLGQEVFEDSKGVIKSPYIEEEQTLQWAKKKYKGANNDLQNIPPMVNFPPDLMTNEMTSEYIITTHTLHNRIGGVMISVLASSEWDRSRRRPQAMPSQILTIQIVFAVFHAKHATLRGMIQ